MRTIDYFYKRIRTFQEETMEINRNELLLIFVNPYYYKRLLKESYIDYELYYRYEFLTDPEDTYTYLYLKKHHLWGWELWNNEIILDDDIKLPIIKVGRVVCKIRLKIIKNNRNLNAIL